MLERFFDWCELMPMNAEGEVVFYMSHGAILILGGLLGVMIVMELVDRLRGGKGVFF